MWYIIGAEATLKRFWKTVGIEAQPGPFAASTSSTPAPDPTKDHLVVTLDKRPLKTPSGSPLLLPKHKSLTATLIAAEWENQETLLKQHSLPMVRYPRACYSRTIEDEAEEKQ